MRLFFGAMTLLTVGLVSCDSGNAKFCACLEAGEELNMKSAEILNGSLTEESQKEMKALREKQKEACADFVNVDGQTMRQWKEDCAKN